jgi:hypothetical protein
MSIKILDAQIFSRDGQKTVKQEFFTPIRKSVEPRKLCAVSDVIVTSSQLKYLWLIANRSAEPGL